MITYEEASAKAKIILNFDYCIEYENYYAFGLNANADLIGPCPVCIRKSDGQIDRLPATNENLGDVIREFDIEEPRD